MSLLSILLSSRPAQHLLQRCSISGDFPFPNILWSTDGFVQELLHLDGTKRTEAIAGESSHTATTNTRTEHDLCFLARLLLQTEAAPTSLAEDFPTVAARATS